MAEGPPDDLLAGLLASNEDYAASYPGGKPARPGRGLAVVACMDARLDVYSALGLEPGDAHVIRNAGGIVTDDVIRSLCLSQRLLGTEAIVLVHHTDCGLEGVSDDEFDRALAQETGISPRWRAGGFDDVEASVHRSMERLADTPFLPNREHMAGFVFHTDSGRLRRVHTPP
ncbi:MAG: beta-class carbonic anhydrase [Actinomycetota bacterium]